MRGPPRGLCRAGCRSAGPEPHGGGIYLTCQGLPFMQGGEEFARTKHGDHNTYRGPLELNRWIGRAPPSWRSWCSIITDCWKSARRIRSFPVWRGMQNLHSVPAGVADRLCARAPGRKPARRLAVYYNPERTRQWRPCLPGAGAICAMVPVPPPNLLAPPAAMPSNSPPSA